MVMLMETFNFFSLTPSLITHNIARFYTKLKTWFAFANKSNTCFSVIQNTQHPHFLKIKRSSFLSKITIYNVWHFFVKYFQSCYEEKRDTNFLEIAIICQKCIIMIAKHNLTQPLILSKILYPIFEACYVRLRKNDERFQALFISVFCLKSAWKKGPFFYGK